MDTPPQFLADRTPPVGADSVENADAKVGRKTVRILLPLPLADAYDYSVPEGVEVAPGHFVVVLNDMKPSLVC